MARERTPAHTTPAPVLALRAVTYCTENVHGRFRYAKLSNNDDSKVKIAPVHSDFLRDSWSLSLMGFAG